MIKPAFLQVNDKVAITSTARKLPKSTIKNGVEVLTQLGFKAVVSDTIGAEHYIFAGNDTHRLQELQRFLDDESIKAIWLARGGYGSIRILEQLNWDNFTKHAKWLIGFSDVTNLLAKVNDLNIACIHGPMPKTINPDFDDDVSVNSLFASLMGKKVNYNWPVSKNCCPGLAKASIVGGNLATLAHIYQSLNPDFFKDKILFIEEIDEYLYQVDRMLRGMKLSGKLNALKGVVVGDFTGVIDNEDPFGETLETIVLNIFSNLNIPIAFGFRAGHQSVNWPIVLGKEYELKASNGQWVLC